jgi:hypothetical protein
VDAALHCTALQGISQSTLQSLVDFIYSGHISLSQGNVQVHEDRTRILAFSV